MRVAPWVIVIVLAPAVAAAQAGGVTGGRDLVVERDADRTSVWPGDRFRYWITLTVPEGIKVSLEDFDPKAMSFAPFVVVSAQPATEPARGAAVRPPDKAPGVREPVAPGQARGGLSASRAEGRGAQGRATRYRFEYVLANYEIGNQTLEVPAQTFRYQRTADSPRDPPVAERRVPPLPLAVRSTLNQPLAGSMIREALPSDATPDEAWRTWAAIGGVGLAASVAPLFVWAGRVVRRRARLRRRNQSRIRREAGRALERLAAEPVGRGEELKRQYRALEMIAREYVRQAWDIEAAALTEVELAPALAETPAPPAERDAVVAVCGHSHHCRYAVDSDEEWRAAFARDLEALQEALRLR